MNTGLIISWISLTVAAFGLPPLLRYLGLPFEIDLIYWLATMALAYAVAGVNIVTQWHRRPIMRLGKYVDTLGPGLSWIDPILHSTLSDHSIRQYVTKLAVENIQTHDNVPVSFSLIVTKQIIADGGVEALVTQVSEGWTASDARAIAVATECVGNVELDSILHNRSDLYKSIRDMLQERVGGWGLAIIAVEFQNIKITDESIEEAIAMKARAKKEGEAELERAGYQKRVAIALREAADQYDEQSWKLKGLETMLELCRSGDNNTVLIPTDLLDAVARLSGKRN